MCYGLGLLARGSPQLKTRATGTLPMPPARVPVHLKTCNAIDGGRTICAMRMRYDFPPDKIHRGIRFWELEEGDGGTYLFHFEEEGSPCKWDTFYTGMSMEETMSDLEEDGDVSRSDWYEVE